MQYIFIMQDLLLFSHLVMSNPLRPYGLQHARPPCPTPTPSLLKLMSFESVMPSNHLVLSHSFSSCLQSFPASGSFSTSQFFALGGQSIGVSASASILSGLISFRIDWLDLHAVQVTLKSLLQRHSSKVSILLHSDFFIVQLSHP